MDYTALNNLAARIGAEHTPDGWMLPFYLPEGQREMVPIEEWLEKRREAAEGSAEPDRLGSGHPTVCHILHEHGIVIDDDCVNSTERTHLKLLEVAEEIADYMKGPQEVTDEPSDSEGHFLEEDRKRMEEAQVKEADDVMQRILQDDRKANDARNEELEALFPADNWKHRGARMQCRTCMWYVSKGDTKLGRCRKHAPVVLQGYPAVQNSDFCGDHKIDENKL